MPVLNDEKSPISSIETEKRNKDILRSESRWLKGRVLDSLVSLSIVTAFTVYTGTSIHFIKTKVVLVKLT